MRLVFTAFILIVNISIGVSQQLTNNGFALIESAPDWTSINKYPAACSQFDLVRANHLTLPGISGIHQFGIEYQKQFSNNLSVGIGADQTSLQKSDTRYQKLRLNTSLLLTSTFRAGINLKLNHSDYPENYSNQQQALFDLGIEYKIRQNTRFWISLTDIEVKTVAKLRPQLHAGLFAKMNQEISYTLLISSNQSMFPEINCGIFYKIAGKIKLIGIVNLPVIGIVGGISMSKGKFDFLFADQYSTVSGHTTKISIQIKLS